MKDVRRSVFVRIATAILLSGATAPLVAQTGEVFAPFVSGLRARSEGAVVQLSWRASQDVSARQHVFRSTAEIDAGRFADAERIAVLAGSATSYRDVPAEPGAYYYAVLLENPEGGLYEIFVAFRNKTSSAASVEEEATVDELAATVTDLHAAEVGAGVEVTFTADRVGRDMLLFRAEAPMATAIDLLTASAPRALLSDAGTVADSAPPGSYYYAIVDAELFKLGRAQLVPGANSTTVAVATGAAAVASSAAGAASPAAGASASTATATPATRTTSAVTTSRQAPLPFLRIGQGVTIDAASLADEPVLDVAPDMAQVAAARDVRLSATALAAVEALLADQRPEARPTSQIGLEILPADASVSSGREDYGLQSVVHEDLLAGNYTAAIARLREYLTLRRSEDTEARAHFYLAQALYFAGEYRNAMLEFMLASTLPGDPTTPWIDATLVALRQG